MIRDLPRTVPNIVRQAAGEVCAYGARVLQSQRASRDVMARHRTLADAERGRDDAELLAMAEAIFAFGILLRNALPIADLHASFQKPDDVRGPHLSIIHKRLEIGGVGGIPGGTLRVELSVSLCPYMPLQLFRCERRFDSYLVHAPTDAMIDSAAELQLKLHPQILRAIHARIADGAVWERIEDGLRSLRTWCRDE